MDKYIRVKNCNCISDATIEIVEKSLNIKYGSNGTGKSTISEAIYAQANNETDRLKDFKPYGSNDNSQPTVDNPYFHVVKVFNEDYVNSYLFQGDEFLDDSFQVFLKSDKCDSLAAQIERMLEELQDLINNIDAIHNLRTFLPQYTAAVKASDGTVSRRGGVAEFVNGNGGGFNHYSELKAYKPFYSRDLPSVAKWAKWRNDGIKQMCGNDCPFCTNILPSSIRSQNEIISKVFKNSALSVANAVLEYVQQAVDQGYILPDAVDVLESYIGDNTKADELYAELQMLAKETDYLYKKIEKICMFKPMNVTHAQLVNLEQSLSELVIEERQLQSFYATDLIKKLIYHVSDKINALKGKTGQLKGLENCVQKVFTNEKAPLRKNLEKVIELRNTSTHFITEEYEALYVPLLQACVFNFVDKMKEFHNIDMTEVIPENFITLSVRLRSLDETEIRGKYTEQVAEKLIMAQKQLDPMIDENNSSFAIRIEHLHYNTKKREEATELYYIDKEAEEGVRIIHDVKNPNDTHKYNAKFCIKEINKRIEKAGIELRYNNAVVKFNQYHFQLFTNYFGIKENDRFCFVYEVSTQPQYSYSQQAIDFIFNEIKKAPDTIIGDLKDKIKKSTPGAKDSK